MRSLATIWMVGLALVVVPIVTGEVIADDSITRTNKQWSLETYPDPFSNPGGCQMTNPGYICDPDMVLEHEEGKVTRTCSNFKFKINRKKVAAFF